MRKNLEGMETYCHCQVYTTLKPLVFRWSEEVYSWDMLDGFVCDIHNYVYARHLALSGSLL